LYGPHKYRDLVKAVGRERIVAVYDDLPALIEQALTLEIPAVLRSQPYNAYWDSNGRARRVGSLADMWVHFNEALENWRDRAALHS
jgi:hypothetical protein